jgi:hypothetical protein
VFSVSVNGASLGTVDIIAAAGAQNTAFKLPTTTSTANLVNGNIVVVLTGVIENPKLSGIEIIEL